MFEPIPTPWHIGVAITLSIGMGIALLGTLVSPWFYLLNIPGFIVGYKLGKGAY
jgi:hypothetical protein